ncbi:MAG: TIGR00730 family Rossman fold protein [Phycisphaerales bacterium]|nr:TIGR00730 family Rossman fold protein [Phycisphaerales bacterium]
MPQPIRQVTVYCASSQDLDRVYFDAAERLGRAIAHAGLMLVYGGGSFGLMGCVADSVHRHGGRVHGIITEKLAALEYARETCDELEIVPTMRIRKQRMEELADAFIALPGGVGTYEELFEMLVARKLRDHDKPLIVVNVNGYFDPLIAMLQRGVDEGFMTADVVALLDVVSEPEQAVERLG